MYASSASILRCAWLALILAPDAWWISHSRLWLFVLVHFNYDGNWTGRGKGAGLKINCLVLLCLLPLEKTRFAIWGVWCMLWVSWQSGTNYELHHYYSLRMLSGYQYVNVVTCNFSRATMLREDITPVSRVRSITSVLSSSTLVQHEVIDLT